MNTYVPLEQFEWWQASADSISRRDDGFALRKLGTYTVPGGVLQDFLNTNHEEDEEVKDFLQQYGPLTNSQKDNRFVSLDEFNELQFIVKTCDSNIENIALIGSAGVNLIFKPHSLFDYLRLLAFQKRINTHICENPQCNNPVGESAGKRADAKVCSRKCGYKVRALKDSMAKERWGCSWADAKKRGKKLVASLDDFKDLSKQDKERTP